MASRAARLPSLALLLLAAVAGGQQRLEPPNPLEPRQGNPFIRDGDSHYSRRQEKRVGAVADKAEIAAAVRAYDTAAEAPDSVEARWKLLRALIFQGLYTQLDAPARLAIFEKARRVSEDAVGMLERRVKRVGGREFAASTPQEIAEALRKDSDAAPTFYWASVAWGRWALARGKEEAVKLGAAEKIRSYASILIAVDPRFEEGGGYRVLGRLHDEAPKMDSRTDWVSRAEAIRNLRLAIQTDAGNFANRLFLAEALASGSAAERSEAVRIAERLVADAPSPSRLVEDLQLQEQATQDLRSWK